MDNDLIEKWAIALALGNNGGDWAKHYKDEHKTFWRAFAKELLEDFSNNRDPRSTESPKRV